MKRSKSIKLVLIGGLSAGALTACAPSVDPVQNVSAQSVYTNNHYLPGLGYYHAPYRAWYPLPYNHFDPQTRNYFYGGQWAPTPHQSITNISAPLPSATQAAQGMRTDVRRGGFGGTSWSHSTWS